MHYRITIKEQCLCRNSHAKGWVQFMSDGEADKEMSDSLMNDMADAMRSAGLGEEEDKPSQDGGDGINQEDSIPAEQPAKEFSESINETESVEDQVNELLDEGEAHSRSNNPQEALVAFNKAIALDPSCDMAWFNRGVLLEAQQDARGARQAFQICLDLNPDHAPATANLAILLDRIGDEVGAAAMARRGLEFFPGHPSLTDVLTRSKNASVEEVPEAIESTITKATHHESTLVNVMADSGVTDSEAILSEAAHHDLDGDGHLDKEELQSAAEVVAATQQIETVIQEAIETEIEKTPIVDEIDLDKLTAEATEMIRQGEPKKALALLKPHLKTIGANHSGAWRIAGGAMARMELDTHAIAALEHATRLDESVASGWYNLGTLYARNDQSGKAIEAFENTIELDKRHLKARMKLIDHAKDSGNVGDVLSHGMAFLEVQDDASLRAEIIEHLLTCGEQEVDVLENITGIPPTMPEAPQLAQYAIDLLAPGASEQRARALTLKGDNIESVKVWKELIQTDKENSGLWKGLARSLEAAGDLDTAQRCHTKANELETGIQAAPAMVPDPQPQPQQQAAIPQIPLAPIQQDITPSQPDTYVTEEQKSEANNLLLTPVQTRVQQTVEEPKIEVDLAKAALDATAIIASSTQTSVGSSSVSNQDISWYNQGIQLIEDGKFPEALSCFDRALPSFANDNEMVIRILNGRGNAFYFMEEYPKCVESYHKAMMIDPSNVRGQTLYNMGTAYAEMERFPDAIKCYEQAMPRGLSAEETSRAKEQIRRCTILEKERQKKISRR